MKVLIFLLFLFHIFRDFFIRFLPKKIVALIVKPGDFVFLVHPRDYKDFYRKYNLKIPKGLLNFILMRLWPLIVAPITGLKDINGKEILGYMIACPMTASQMLSNRNLAQKRILESVKLAEKLGAKIIGLGALTASLTKGGLDIRDKVKIGLTSGYAYTTFSVTTHALRACKTLNMNLNKILIAVVGAAGNVGSNSVKLMAKNGAKRFLLIDLPRKKTKVYEIIKFLNNKYPDIVVSYSDDISKIRCADLIITATNSPEAVIKSDYIKSGSVIIDDAQPSDVDYEVMSREDIIVLSGGVVHTPGVRVHFNFGLASKYDNYSCLAEVLALTANKWHDHYSIGELKEDSIRKIKVMGERLGFNLGSFQNEYKQYSSVDFSRIKEIRSQYKT